MSLCYSEAGQYISARFHNFALPLLFLGGIFKHHHDTQRVAHRLHSSDKKKNLSAFAGERQTVSTSSCLYFLPCFDALKHQSVCRLLTFSTNIRLTFERRARLNLLSSCLKSGFTSISTLDQLPALTPPHVIEIRFNLRNLLRY